MTHRKVRRPLPIERLCFREDVSQSRTSESASMRASLPTSALSQDKHVQQPMFMLETTLLVGRPADWAGLDLQDR